MNIQLIQGQFNATETLDLLTEMIHVKIKFHENKIKKENQEEDIKSRESKIKFLQSELYELKQAFLKDKDTLRIEANIKIERE